MKAVRETGVVRIELVECRTGKSRLPIRRAGPQSANKVKKIPREPYAELHAVLETFTAGVQNALKDDFVGAYLIGSLTTGDLISTVTLIS
jgi:hypothetical protein